MKMILEQPIRDAIKELYNRASKEMIANEGEFTEIDQVLIRDGISGLSNNVYEYYARLKPDGCIQLRVRSNGCKDGIYICGFNDNLPDDSIVSMIVFLLEQDNLIKYVWSD